MSAVLRFPPRLHVVEPDTDRPPAPVMDLAAQSASTRRCPICGADLPAGHRRHPDLNGDDYPPAS